jgi:hypothetical protein
MEKVHAIERELYGEIVQIKKERLVQVTRRTATQTIKSVYCGWQSRTGPERYAKFYDNRDWLLFSAIVRMVYNVCFCWFVFAS